VTSTIARPDRGITAAGPLLHSGRSPTAWRSPLATGPHSGRRHCCDRPTC